MAIDLKYSSQDCHVCHGDISLKNLAIHRVMDEDEEDFELDDDIDDESIEDICHESDNVSNPISKTSPPNVSNVTEPQTTSDVSSPTEALTGAHTTPDAISPVDSSSQPEACIAPAPISSHGLVIDNDNSFSLVDVKKYGYRVNSVSDSPTL